ncbi:hypothetical protein OIV83_004722 [Microbotryomycetes sp. JL201]|nr:hypothetical protein OIV83_004722 [Microbotryomycetes sp. JL201]
MQKLKGLSLPSFSSSSSAAAVAGGATEPALDDHVRSSLDARRQLLQKLAATCAKLHKAHTKVKPHPLAGITSEKDHLHVWLASDLSSGADAIDQATTDGSAAHYVSTLKALGSAHLALARHHSTCADTLDEHVLQQLDMLLKQYKEYDRALKDADKLRNILEAKLAKKAKSGTEDDSEVQAELDYEDACTNVTQLANHLWANLATEQDIVAALLDAQLELARQSVEELQAVKDQLATSAPRTTKPASPVLTRAIPNATTRPSRSASDSNALRPPTFASSDRPSSSGSNRRSTLSGSGASSPKRPTLPDFAGGKNRSRSSSMLSRFAPNAILGRNKKSGDKSVGRDEEDDEDDGQRSDDDYEDRLTRTRAGARFDQGSRSVGHSPNRSRPSPTALRSSFVGNARTHHGDGDDDDVKRDILSGVSLSPSVATSMGTSVQRKRTPLKRMHTAPNPRTSLDLVDSVNHRMSTVNSRGSGNSRRYVQAKWSFKGSSTDELDLVKGDFVRVVSQINDDWWTGKVVSSTTQSSARKSGMFPRAYVVDVQQLPNEIKDFTESGDEDDNVSFLSRTNSKSSRFGGQGTTTDDDDDLHHDEDEDVDDDDVDGEGRRGDKSRFFNESSTTPTTTPKKYLTSAASSSSALAGFGKNVNGVKLKERKGQDHASSPFAD